MDNLFKALLVIFLIAFLYLYYENSNKDRYFYIQENRAVFDKKTGTIYQGFGPDSTGLFSLDIINGIQRKYSWNRKDDR